VSVSSRAADLPLQDNRAGRFRHVVFAGPGGRAARIVNLAPPAAADDRPDDADRGRRLTDEEESFVGSVFACAGLDARAYRPESLGRRVQACLRALRAGSIREARLTLAHNPPLVAVAINAIVIGVSSFFRDPPVFDEIASGVLPSLARSRTAPRVWSVGCSDGQELYSVAILLAELNLLDGCYLLGTDCRSDAVRRARDGVYGAAALQSVPGSWARKYFTPQDADGTGERWRIAASLRAAVQWRRADVTRVQEPGIWDLILCRNMAMYLQPEASGKLWELFERALRPGGYLVLGKAERPVNAKRLSPVGPCLFRRDRG
jgi:chemotaxis methyl-accepting protein methylase